MQHPDGKKKEHSEPDVARTIRGAIGDGFSGKSMTTPDNWLSEFWEIGASLRDYAEMVRGFQASAGRQLLRTTKAYLASDNAAAAGSRV